MKGLTEIELIILIKQGNITAFDEFYKRNWRPLYTTAYRAVASVEDAKDIIQDVFVGFWNNREALNADLYNSAYLFRALKNNLINFYRKDTLRKKNIEQLLLHCLFLRKTSCRAFNG